jgi:hypothetical protein
MYLFYQFGYFSIIKTCGCELIYYYLFEMFFIVTSFNGN